MARKYKKRPNTGSSFFIVVILAIFAALFGGYRLYTGFFPDSLQFNYIVISKNGDPLKILQGETVKFHPSDLCKIQEISTNIYFNYGIRLASTGMDINGLLYEETVLDKLLPDNSAFSRHRIPVEVKHQADVLGTFELIIEPKIEDWIDKVNRTIGSEKKIKILEEAINEGFNDNQIISMLADEYVTVSEWDKAAALLEKICRGTGRKGKSPETAKGI